MGDWEVALILVAVSVVLLLAAAIICRVFGIWRLTSCFASDEETQGLTKHEQTNGYMVDADADSDLRLDNSGKFMEYDPLNTDPKYMHLEETPPTPPPEPVPKPQPASERHDTSPVSVDSLSIMSSDAEGGAPGLPRATSCESIASDSSVMDLEPEMPKIGQLEFGVQYDRGVSELVISVIQARDLESSEVTGTLDSYVKLWLSPHPQETRLQTKVQKNSTSPVYKERFLFTVDEEYLSGKTVQFQVYSSDKYARHKLLGETELKLGDIDLNQAIRISMNLRDMDEKPTDFGDLMFSLSYLPTAERLTVVIVKARNLKWSQSRESGDCFVKVYLLQNGKKTKKKKVPTATLR